VRLYVTLIRFDAVYVSIFKTNKQMIRYGYPALNKWMKNLYWNVNAFKETTDFKHIKSHYFESLTFLNPSAIVPEGPVPDIESLE
jgi:glutathionyl-hydroquinone reductase